MDEFSEKPEEHNDDSPVGEEKSIDPQVVKTSHLLVVIFAPILFMAFGGCLVGAIGEFVDIDQRVSLSLLQIVFVALPTLLLFKIFKRKVARVEAVKSLKILPFIGLIFFLGGLIVVSDAVLLKLLEWAPRSLVESFEAMVRFQEQLTDIHKWYEYLWFILVVVLGAGIFEELLFRGLTLNMSLKIMSIRKAILLNGVLFAALHMNILAFVYYFALGVALAYIAFRSGTILYGVILHSLLNFMVLVFFKLFGTDMDGFPLQPKGVMEIVAGAPRSFSPGIDGIPLHWTISYGLGGLAIIAGIYIFHKTQPEKPPAKTVPA